MDLFTITATRTATAVISTTTITTITAVNNTTTTAFITTTGFTAITTTKFSVHHKGAHTNNEIIRKTPFVSHFKKLQRVL